MNVGVRLRFELVGEEPAVRLGELDGLLIHPEAFERARREDDLGAEHAHELAPLDGEAVGHGHHERIALLRADHGEADARIAACRLDNGLAGLECAAALAFLNDVERKPVLDRSRRIEELGLGVDRPAGDAEIVDADGRRIADRVDNAVEEPAASSSRSELKTGSAWATSQRHPPIDHS